MPSGAIIHVSGFDFTGYRYGGTYFIGYGAGGDNNGIGITGGSMPKLFKFTTKPDMDIELGLYVSKNIVEAHVR